MAHNKKAADQRKSNEDQVLRTAVMTVIVLFVVAALIVGIRFLNPRPDTAEGVKKLKQMEQTDLDEIEKEIQALNTKEAEAQKKRDSRPNTEKFKNTLIIGDYIAQGLYEQGVLEESFVLASSDASVYGMDDTQMVTNLEAALRQKPKILFLMLGANDASKEEVNADIFEKKYIVFLEYVQEKLPDTKIFVNSILPVQEQAAEEEPGLSEIPEYNKKLKSLCRERGVIFIDNDSLVKAKYYRDDGKHMKKQFYKLWAKHMVEAADL